MKGILKESTIAAFANVKNIFRNVAIWTMIAGIVLGAICIMVQGTSSSDIVSRMMAMFFIMALAMLISTNNAKRIDSEHASVQILALVSLAFNVIWFILWTICIWIAFRTDAGDYTLLARFAVIASIIAGFGLVASNTMNIYEGTKKGIVLPLKIASVSCLGVSALHGIIRAATFTVNDIFAQNDIMVRFDKLAYFMSFCWFVTLIMALINSSSETSKIKAAERQENLKKRREMMQQQMVANQQRLAAEQQAAAARIAEQQAAKDKPKTDDELRAEIEEKVRREMIEKEVREKLEKEAKEKIAKAK